MLMERFLVNRVRRKEKVRVIIVIIHIVILRTIQIAVMAGTSSHVCWALLVLLSLAPLVGGHSLTQNTETEKETETPGHRKGAERGDSGRRVKRRWPQCPPVN